MTAKPRATKAAPKNPAKPDKATTKQPSPGQLVIAVWEDAIMDADEACALDALGRPTGNPHPTGSTTITPGWFLDQDDQWIRIAWWYSPTNDTETFTTITRIPRAWTTKIVAVSDDFLGDELLARIRGTP